MNEKRLSLICSLKGRFPKSVSSSERFCGRLNTVYISRSNVVNPLTIRTDQTPKGRAINEQPSTIDVFWRITEISSNYVCQLLILEPSALKSTDFVYKGDAIHSILVCILSNENKGLQDLFKVFEAKALSKQSNSNPSKTKYLFFDRSSDFL